MSVVVRVQFSEMPGADTLAAILVAAINDIAYEDADILEDHGGA